MSWTTEFLVQWVAVGLAVALGALLLVEVMG